MSGAENTLRRERWFYLLLVSLIAASVFAGFSQTYLTREQLLDAPETLPLAVHVHGMTFLAWYVLLVFQAVLVVRGSMGFHRLLGIGSLALAALMVAGGLLVVAVKMDAGLAGNDDYWASFSLMILSNLVLFCLFIGAALRFRGQPDLHRRLILLAAASASGAAQFRTLMGVFGFEFWVTPAGILATNLFILLAMLGDRLIRGRVHRLYFVSLLAVVLFECAMFGLAFTAPGLAFQRIMVELLRPFFGLY